VQSQWTFTNARQLRVVKQDNWLVDEYCHALVDPNNRSDHPLRADDGNIEGIGCQSDQALPPVAGLFGICLFTRDVPVSFGFKI